MNIVNEAKSNWPIVVGGLVGIYVVYKYMGSSSTSAAPVATSGTTPAQDALYAQSASDQLHANVAMAQINANQQTATLATQVGGTVALAKIQQTSTDSNNSLAMGYASNILSTGVEYSKNDTNLTLGLAANQTAQFGIASNAQTVQLGIMSGAQTAQFGIASANQTQQMQIQTTGIIGVINANNQVPLATVNANAMLDLANINHDVALTTAQVGVITAQNQVPISYYNNMSRMQSTMNASVPLMVNSVSAPAPVAPAAAYNVNPNIAASNAANSAAYNTSQANMMQNVSNNMAAIRFGQ